MMKIFYALLVACGLLMLRTTSNARKNTSLVTLFVELLFQKRYGLFFYVDLQNGHRFYSDHM
jgi:hypothetical protein